MQPVEQRDEVEMLSLMLLIRRFEERASQQYKAQKIGGFCHLYIGQEAVVTGAVAAVRDDDYIITAYRDHAHALARGTNANACMAELFGKKQAAREGCAVRCIFSTRNITCMVATQLSPRTFHWQSGWLLPSSTGAKIASPFASLVTAQSIKA